MRTLSQLFLLGIAAALAACSNHDTGAQPDASYPVENCFTAGDEDGNGLADCNDPVCSGTPACLTACGNGKVEAGEQCDDGNAVDGDGCEKNCTSPACGNSIVDLNERCDDGNAVDN